VPRLPPPLRAGLVVMLPLPPSGIVAAVGVPALPLLPRAGDLSAAGLVDVADLVPAAMWDHLDRGWIGGVGRNEAGQLHSIPSIRVVNLRKVRGLGCLVPSRV
jgi:hypothetical protein